METTMERPHTYAAVGFGRAFVEQFRLLWMSRRPILLLIGMLGILGLAGEPWADDPDMARLFVTTPVWLLLIGPFWAFAVWHNEGPSSRLYFWSQPVSRTAHSLARVAAGAAWLVTLYGAVILAAMLMAAIDGNLAHFGLIGATAWVNFFTAPLFGYLMISVLTVPSDYPIRWFLAILFGLPIVGSLLVEGLGLGEELERLVRPIIDMDWGLGVTMLAPFIIAYERLDDVVSGDDFTLSESDFAREFNPELWWITTPLWLLFWVGIIALLARRHPDVFPRWRRGR